MKQIITKQMLAQVAIVAAGCLLMSACQKPPATSTELLSQAELNIHTGNLQQAFAQLSQVMAKDPNNIEMHLNLGWAYAMTNEFDKALKEIHMIESVSPKNPDLSYLRGFLFAKQKQWVEALEAYEKALETDERNRPFIHADIAHAFLQVNEPEAALAEYDLALKMDPDSGDYQFGRCQAFRQMKDYDQAMAACEVAKKGVQTNEERGAIDDVIESIRLIQSLKEGSASDNGKAPLPGDKPAAAVSFEH